MPEGAVTRMAEDALAILDALGIERARRGPVVGRLPGAVAPGRPSRAGMGHAIPRAVVPPIAAALLNHFETVDHR